MGVKCEIDFDICSFWWIISKEKLAMNLFALKCIISANWLNISLETNLAFD